MWHGFFVQLEVIHALLLREMKTRFGTHKLGYLWVFVNPVMWIATFAAMAMIAGRTIPQGMGIVSYLVTGIVVYLMFRETMGRAGGAIASNRGLLFYPHVRPLDLVLARTTLEFGTQITVFIVLMVVAGVVEGDTHSYKPLTTLAGLLLALGLGTGVGMVFCGLGVFFPTVLRLQGPLMRPMMWISGIFFSVRDLPSAARHALLYNPLVHAIELVRGGSFAGYPLDHVSYWYPTLWVVVLLFFGLTLERVTRRRLAFA